MRRPALDCPDAEICLLYTSDAADERSSVDLGGRRIIKKKTPIHEYADAFTIIEYHLLYTQRRVSVKEYQMRVTH